MELNINLVQPILKAYYRDNKKTNLLVKVYSGWHPKKNIYLNDF